MTDAERNVRTTDMNVRAVRRRAEAGQLHGKVVLYS